MSEASSLSFWPRRSSPTAPVSQAFVDCGSSVTARIRPPSFGCFSRIRASRLAWRRSYSRRAEAPGVPGSMGSGSRDGRRAPSSTSGGAGEASSGGWRGSSRGSGRSWWTARRSPRPGPAARHRRPGRRRRTGASSASRRHLRTPRDPRSGRAGSVAIQADRRR